MAESSQTPIGLMDLPPELHLMIASYLPFPDAYSLKRTSRYFHNAIYIDHSVYVSWLISRRTLHVYCPTDNAKPCLLGTDRDFCRGSIKLLMERRREHGECERTGDSLGTGRGRGCLVYGTKGPCKWRKEGWGEWWMRICREAGSSISERMDWFAWGVLFLVVVWGAGVAWRWTAGDQEVSA